MASQEYKAWPVVTASTTAFTVRFMVWMMFGIVRVSLGWMYFTEVRPMNIAERRKHPEPTHFS